MLFVLAESFRRGIDWVLFLKQFVTDAETITGQHLALISQTDAYDPNLNRREVELLQKELETLTSEVSRCLTNYEKMLTPFFSIARHLTGRTRAESRRG